MKEYFIDEVTLKDEKDTEKIKEYGIKRVLEKNERWIKRNKKLLSHLNEIKPVDKTQYCAYFHNNSWGDREDPYCNRICDIRFYDRLRRTLPTGEEVFIKLPEEFPTKKNIWIGNSIMMTIIKINDDFYDMEDIKKLKEKYNLK